MYICCNCGAVNPVHSHSPGDQSTDVPASAIDSAQPSAIVAAPLDDVLSYHVAEEPPAGAVSAPEESADQDSNEANDEQPEESEPSVPVRKGYVVAGASLIALCCALALVVGHLPWVGAALTFVAMVGGGLATFGPEIQMKRPRFGRAVLATFGALLVLLVEPVQRVGAMW